MYDTVLIKELNSKGRLECRSFGRLDCPSSSAALHEKTA